NIKRFWLPADLQPFALAAQLNEVADVTLPTWTFIPGGKLSTHQQGDVPVQAFLMAKAPITQQQFACFVQANPWEHHIPGYAKYDEISEDYEEYAWNRDEHTPPADKGDHPVIFVTLQDASTYCAWLQKTLQDALASMEGTWTVTLPTIQEWEFAARGETDRQYAWGHGLSRALANYDNPDGTTPVGQFQPPDRLFDLDDMTGNVWEWTRTAVTGKGDAEHYVKGGSWMSDAVEESLQISFNNPESVHEVSPYIGFRVVITQTGETSA
ncbi:MAG: SUMF1/EgtB/PvdO family nonheme iron enzyme, partial [Chloroflexota bacterium]